MDWNFVVEKCGLPIRNITQVPVSPGYYLLFAENGDFIYVGKAKNIRNRLTDHFGLDEETNGSMASRNTQYGYRLRRLPINRGGQQ